MRVSSQREGEGLETDAPSVLTGTLMHELLPGFVDSLHQSGRAPDTISNYRQRVEAFLRWRQDRALTLRLLYDYKDYLQQTHTGREGEGCRPRTIRGHFAALAAFWKYAAGQGYTDLPPIASVPLPRLDPPHNVCPSERQVDALLAAAPRVGKDAADPQYREYLRWRAVAIITLGLACGLRRSDMKSLNLGDLTQDAKGWRLRIRKSKGGQTRQVPVPAFAYENLKGWLAVREAKCAAKPAASAHAFLVDPQGRRMGDRSIDKALSQVLLLAGLEDSGITCHSLRHGCATLLIRLGVDIRVIQEILGHSDVATTAKYLHSDYDSMKAAQDRLGARLGGELPAEPVARWREVRPQRGPAERRGLTRREAGRGRG